MSIFVTTTAYASEKAGSASQVTEVQTSQSLLEIVEEYDYQLSRGAQASDKTSREATQNEMNTKIKSQFAGSSEAELRKQMNEVIEQIPSAEKKQALKKKLQFADKKELEAIAANPTVLSQALHGTGSNFNFSSGGDVLLAIGAIAVVAILISAVANAASYRSYYSYLASYPTYDGSGACSAYDLSSNERSNMQADALRVCRIASNNPDTCRLAGWETEESFDRDYYGNIVFGYCDIRAEAEAKR